MIVMKRMFKLFVLILSVSLFSGCEEDLVSTDSLVQNEMELKAGKNAVIASVTGSGNIHRDYGDVGDVWRTFSFNAIKKADGSVKGHFQLNNHGQASLKGDVLCFSFFPDNKAVLLVKWTKATGIEAPDYYGYIVVQDNGEGIDPPDKISLHHWMTELSDCGILYEVTMYDIEAGNVQIHKVDYFIER